MTNTDGDSKILKTDVLGRVRTPAARREQLLDEFEKSGACGAKFAELVGVKYQTFASWMQERRRQRNATTKRQAVKSSASAVRWLEALAGNANGLCDGAGPAQMLLLHLPGNARLELTCATQIPLAVALVRALEKSAVPC